MIFAYQNIYDLANGNVTGMLGGPNSEWHVSASSLSVQLTVVAPQSGSSVVIVIAGTELPSFDLSSGSNIYTVSLPLLVTLGSTLQNLGANYTVTGTSGKFQLQISAVG